MQSLVEYLLNNEPEVELNEDFIQKYFTGRDEDALNKFKAAVKENKMTKLEKNSLITEIDKAIDDSNRIFTAASLEMWAAHIVGGAITSGILPLMSTIGRIYKSGNAAAYRETLMGIRSIIKAKKTVD